MGKTVIKAIKEIRGVMRARVAGAANLSSGDLLPGFKQRVGAMRGASHLARGPSRALWAEGSKKEERAGAQTGSVEGAQGSLPRPTPSLRSH